MAAQGKVVAANHFASDLSGVGMGWMPRSLCAGDSAGRARAMEALAKMPEAKDLDWFGVPIANSFSRLVMVTEASGEVFMTVGVNGGQPVTALTNLH
jgi:hypothetical protein